MGKGGSLQAFSSMGVSAGCVCVCLRGLKQLEAGYLPQIRVFYREFNVLLGEFHQIEGWLVGVRHSGATIQLFTKVVLRERRSVDTIGSYCLLEMECSGRPISATVMEIGLCVVFMRLIAFFLVLITCYIFIFMAWSVFVHYLLIVNVCSVVGVC